MENCKNCGSQLQPEDKFCSNCGQKVIERLKVRTLLGELAAAFLAWDSKLFKTLRLLLLKPGQASKNYIEGKRKGYVAPLRIYLFFSVIFFITVSYFGIRIDSDGNVQNNDNMVNLQWSGDSLEMDRDTLLLMKEHERLDELPMIKEQSHPYAKKFMRQLVILAIDGKNFNSLFRTNLSYMLFLFIPIFAIFLKIFYWKKKFDFIEHLVYGLYFHSFIFLMLTVTLLAARAVDNAFPLLIGIIGTVIYFVVGQKKFYEYKWGWIITKTVFIGLIYAIIGSLFTLITVLLSVWFY